MFGLRLTSTGLRSDFAFKQLHSTIQSPVKRLFLELQHSFDLLFLHAQLREDIRHLRSEDIDELVEEGLFELERAAILHGAAENAAEGVVAVAIAGLDAVGDGEAEGAQMIRDDAEGDVDLFLFGDGDNVALLVRLRQCALVVLAAELRQLVKDGLEDVGVVVADLRGFEVGEVLRALDDAGEALEAHAGIDMLRGQRGEGAVGVGVVLDEDVVPDLDAAGVAAIDELCAFALAVFAQLDGAGGEVDVNLRAGAAGAGVGHHPEVVLLVAVDDVDIGIEADGAEFFSPEVPAFFVTLGGVAFFFVRLIDGGKDAARGEFEALDDELPGPRDGFFFEVVAEGPVPEHLEEGVVVGVEAHVFEVVVLAASADALLRVGRTGGQAFGQNAGPGVHVRAALTKEDGDELVHACIGEDACAVAAGVAHVVTGDDGVLLRLEEVEEGLADLGGGRDGGHGQTRKRARRMAREHQGSRSQGCPIIELRPIEKGRKDIPCSIWLRPMDFSSSASKEMARKEPFVAFKLFPD